MFLWRRKLLVRSKIAPCRSLDQFVDIGAFSCQVQFLRILIRRFYWLRPLCSTSANCWTRLWRSLSLSRLSIFNRFFNLLYSVVKWLLDWVLKGTVVLFICIANLLQNVLMIIHLLDFRNATAFRRLQIIWVCLFRFFRNFVVKMGRRFIFESFFSKFFKRICFLKVLLKNNLLLLL